MGETRRGPLDGYRILELTTTVSGPMAAMTLADQGAEVLKIEPPFTGDTARFLGPARNGMAAMFATVNRNKKSVCLDLKVDEERAIFLDLVRTADALIENYRPGVLDRMGLGYEALSSIRPELVYASITGYGTGPYENRRVFDPLIQATAGTAAAQGGDDPENVRMIIFDKVTALTTAQAVTAALLERARTGRGQYLPITMLESAPAHRSRSAACAKPPRPFRRSTRRGSARILSLSSGNLGSMAKRSLVCSLVTPRTRRPCTPCSRLGRQPRLPQPTTDTAGAENVGQRGSFSGVRV
ncbi:MAG: hypothetical protein EBY44_05640 [Actinobacteria bacterium]|nr:hypothetical protein [Actinomycetota bacterium]